MADIFISYSKRHARLTEDLAHDLAAKGYTTWWDTSLLPDDVNFPQTIREQIRAAKAVIVIWAEHSIGSRWVYSEASGGDEQGKLFQFRDDTLDPRLVPMPFKTGNITLLSDRAKLYAALERRKIAPSRPLVEVVADTVMATAGETSERPDLRPHEPPASYIVPEHEYWADTKDRADPAAFERFLVRFPDGDFAALAASRAEERIASCNDPDVLERLLREFPNSPRGGKAKARLALLLWRELERSRDKAALGDFARRFAGSPEAEKAGARLERLQGGTPSATPKVLAGVAVAFLGTGVFWYAQRDGDAPPSPAVEPVVEQPKQPQEVPPRPRRITKLDPDRASVPLSVGELAVLKPKDEFQECKDCPRTVVIPSGSFTMGSPEDEPQRSDDEGPQHPVTIAKPFAAGKFAVTFAEWDACVADGGCGGYRPSDEGWGRADRPVINVSWDDAKAYTKWLSNKTGAAYRLLSEAEREYVTRAGTTTPFWWGSSITPEQANYNGNEVYKGGGEKGEYRGKTLPVKSFRPNPWGLYQVHGNVWEWVEDCWHSSYQGAPDDGSAWTSGKCEYRVLRGGSWINDPQELRAANRFKNAPDNRSSDLGFRVARTLVRQE